MGLTGLILDSSAVITAERKRQSVTDFIESILAAHGEVDLSLSPVTVAELVHGIYRAKTPEVAERRGRLRCCFGLLRMIPGSRWRRYVDGRRNTPRKVGASSIDRLAWAYHG